MIGMSCFVHDSRDARAHRTDRRLDRKGSAFQLTNMQVDDNCQDDQDRFDKT
jgi:hypothetical protein